MATLLYVTDLTYQARGRRYCDEDIYLSARLREHYTVALAHPLDAARLMADFDVTVVRNSGPVIHFRDGYEDFRTAAAARNINVYNELTGKADMIGKQYLVDLSRAGEPVTPTIDHRDDLGRLPGSAEYVIKPKFGADSVGLAFVTDVSTVEFGDVLLQPRIDFRYEVSFYFVGRDFQYALYAPQQEHRWELVPYLPTDSDLAFAQRFVDWNDIDRGIQRVDACRTLAGDLLLVELEDLNPYLSLDVLDAETRERFVLNLLHNLDVR